VSTNYFSMWSILSLMAFGAVGGAAVHGDLLGSIRAAYPSNSIQGEALHRCSRMDTGFSRFSEQDRDSCYRAILPGFAQAASETAGER
jgi:hypothetical protein